MVNKLEEIQAKYRKALNLAESSEKKIGVLINSSSTKDTYPKNSSTTSNAKASSNTAEGNTLKKTKEKRSSKELPFSMDEFKSLKNQVNKGKPSKPEPKQTPKAKEINKIKTQRFDRSTSLKRRKVALESKDMSKERKNFSRPKTLVTKPEEKNLDAIKNSILKIKEKAFGGGDEESNSNAEPRPINYASQVRAQVTVSSINLGNVKDQTSQSQIFNKNEQYNKVIETFSLRHNIDLDETPEKVNISQPSINEDSVNTSTVSKGRGGTQKMKKASTITDNTESKVKKYMGTDSQSNKTPTSKVVKSTSLERVPKASTLKHQNKTPTTAKKKKTRTVRFDEEAKNQKVDSELENYRKCLELCTGFSWFCVKQRFSPQQTKITGYVWKQRT